MLGRILDLMGRGTRSDAPPVYHSRFGGLWIDRLDAKRVLDEKARRDPRMRRLREKLAFFIDNGYVILEKAVDPRAIDRYLADLAASVRDSALQAMVFVNRMPGYAVVPLADANLAAPLTKILDTYVHVASARELIFAPAIEEFLRAVFEEGALAFQGLHFEKGSTQSVHQDTAYVVCEEPMRLCASWIALEDVVPGSGELFYYAGSHRLPDWLYSGQHKHFALDRDGNETHLAHLQSLHDRSKERGLALQRFMARKGDALIWAADLAHGGSQISDPALTRRSLVTHYAPESNAPHWFRGLPEGKRVRVTVRPGCSYCTSYY
jgi:ectoine hydroxylase-related dioxygenase (phytanoyl-CoA dioxygenase family)